MSEEELPLITLLHHTPLHICSHATRTCWQSFAKGDNGGEIDCELIDRVGNQYRHSSTLEHLYYNFYIQGISRTCLQELARHRIASLSVKSTRYTLKELKQESSFLPINSINIQRAKQFIIFTENQKVNEASIHALEQLRGLLSDGISNDLAKFAMPECYRTELTWSVNARSLQNFFTLRSSKKALWEIRRLAFSIYKALPKEHLFIFKRCMEVTE
ncbi:thymidylate synthase (FAD) [Helicobacter monodelphidis]|uniref:FAD-dependent thymidylate synthase n=1 Tax=Helicobacter sp. 15-1451 TaxID=2004995 RepID=UPI000DCE778E|nr:FAD-dependent thymidylate synthase [Helicobacter sp. 15-1451]RAX58928.1 thymidylate synthase (FAD) [Helicobacter sp. 15-1451]